MNPGQSGAEFLLPTGNWGLAARPEFVSVEDGVLFSRVVLPNGLFAHAPSDSTVIVASNAASSFCRI